jgi:hypothetical protein
MWSVEEIGKTWTRRGNDVERRGEARRAVVQQEYHERSFGRRCGWIWTLAGNEKPFP